MTDTTQAVERVIKTDVLGRMKTPAGRRETLLDEFERSGPFSADRLTELDAEDCRIIFGQDAKSPAAMAHSRSII